MKGTGAGGLNVDRLVRDCHQGNCLYLFCAILCNFAVGGFELDQMTTGKIANINLWDYEMTPEEISSLSWCAEGNVVNSATLQFSGDNSYESIELLQIIGKGRVNLSISNTCACNC